MESVTDPVGWENKTDTSTKTDPRSQRENQKRKTQAQARQETKTKPEGVVSSSKKTQSKADGDSGEIMGDGGLPDPHPV
mgnify:CR=1 FL=1